MVRLPLGSEWFDTTHPLTGNQDIALVVLSQRVAFHICSSGFHEIWIQTGRVNQSVESYPQNVLINLSKKSKMSQSESISEDNEQKVSHFWRMRETPMLFQWRDWRKMREKDMLEDGG